jgi:hypothetical protein
MAQLRIEKFCQFADKITLPFSLADLRSLKDDPATEKLLEARSKQLAKNRIPSRPFSAQYFGRDGIPLVFYLGERIADDPRLEYALSEEEMGKGWGNVDKQLENRTVLDLAHAKRQGKQIFSDGLDVSFPPHPPSLSSTLIKSLVRTIC